MNVDQATAALNHAFLQEYPAAAAREIERLDPELVLPALNEESPTTLAPVWEQMLPSVAATLLLRLSKNQAQLLLAQLDPTLTASLMDRMSDQHQSRLFELMETSLNKDVRFLMQYPQDSAGRLMDAQVATLRRDTTASEAIGLLRSHASSNGRLRFVFLLDNKKRPEAVVDLHDIVMADANVHLSELSRPVTVAVTVLDPKEDVVDRLAQTQLEELPVVDIHGKLMGVIRSEKLRHALHEESSADLLTMVGVGREERVLSPVLFSVRKRLLWMHVNLLTAFAAASVVGLFESTIAQFTALAVLMPVVAGMGGNMGSQALAVTLRGLALREVTARQWVRIFFKELRVGMINGFLIALTTGLTVLLWSGNQGLALVIFLAMSISLSIACVAGAMVPIVLTRLGQDPAQSSAIFLTTITDITGFMSFLGIATLLAAILM